MKPNVMVLVSNDLIQLSDDLQPCSYIKVILTDLEGELINL